MNSNKNLYILIAVALVLGAFAFFVPKSGPIDMNVRGTGDSDFINANFTPTSVNVSSTRTKLLSLNANRVAAEICNPNVASSSDPTGIVWILLSSASTSVSTSTNRPIPGGQCYSQIGDLFHYTGEVWAIKNSAIVTAVSVQEK